MKDLIIFGTGKIADVIYYYATNECNIKVVAFTVDDNYTERDTFHDLPVIAFSNLEKSYPPDQYDMFIAIGYQDLNRLRQLKYNEAKAKGYHLISIIPPNANLPANVKAGDNCFIMPPAIIHPFVEIGNNTFVWNGAMIGHHTSIGDHCWLTSMASISGAVNVGDGSFFAVNATVGHDVTIGNNCFIGANTLVTKNLLDKQVVIQSSSKVIRLNSFEFLRFSKFSSV